MKALDWWNQHKTSPGMDTASRRNLLRQIEDVATEYATIRAECEVHDINNGTETVAIWDETFATEVAQMRAAIAEIRDTLPDD